MGQSRLQPLHETQRSIASATASDAAGKFTFAPQLSVAHTESLLDRSIRRHLCRSVVECAENILRNFDRIRNGQHHDWALGAFVTQSTTLLIRAGRRHWTWSKWVLEQPGHQDLLAISREEKAFVIYYQSSEASQTELAQARSEGLSMVCWVEDSPIPRQPVYVERPRFLDLANGHGH